MRKAFALKLSKELQRASLTTKASGKAGAPPHFLYTRKQGLPPSYMAILALAGVDVDGEHASQARAYLLTSATFFRKQAERLKQDQPSRAARMTLEMQLPYLVHMLAHHPNLERQGEDEPSLLSTQKCLDFFLSAVAATPTPHYDMVRKMIGMMKRLPDRIDPRSREVHVVADVARALLAERTKGGWTTMVVPDQLGVPHYLFGAAGPHAATMMYEDVDMLPRGFKLVEFSSKSGGAKKCQDAGAHTAHLLPLTHVPRRPYAA